MVTPALFPVSIIHEFVFEYIITTFPPLDFVSFVIYFAILTPRSRDQS